MSGLTLEDYTEKCIVVRGDTKTHAQKLLELGGKHNDRLKRGGPGWIFPMTKKDVVQKFMRTAGNSGRIPKQESVVLTVEEYKKLLGRIDTLEKEHKNLQLQIECLASAIGETITDEGEEALEKENDEENSSHRRLLPISDE